MALDVAAIVTLGELGDKLVSLPRLVTVARSAKRGKRGSHGTNRGEICSFFSEGHALYHVSLDHSVGVAGIRARVTSN